MDTTEPTAIYAGDSVEWTKSISGYPASEWALTYYFKNATQFFSLEGVVDGDSFLLSANSTVTAAWASGQYHWQAFVSKPDPDNKRILVSEGGLLVQPNPAAMEPQDFRTHNEKILDSIKGMLEGRGDVEEYSIQGRSIRKMSIKDLEYWKSIYLRRVSREKGLGPFNQLVRFERP